MRNNVTARKAGNRAGRDAAQREFGLQYVGLLPYRPISSFSFPIGSHLQHHRAERNLLANKILQCVQCVSCVENVVSIERNMEILRENVNFFSNISFKGIERALQGQR